MKHAQTIREIEHHANYFQAVPYGSTKVIRTYSVEQITDKIFCICFKTGDCSIPIIDQGFPSFASRSEAELALDMWAGQMGLLHLKDTPRGVMACVTGTHRGGGRYA